MKKMLNKLRLIGSRVKLPAGRTGRAGRGKAAKVIFSDSGIQIVKKGNGMFSFRVDNARELRIEKERAYAKIREENSGSRANYVLK